MNTGRPRSALVAGLAVLTLTDSGHTGGQKLHSMTVSLIHLIFWGHVPGLKPLSPAPSNGKAEVSPDRLCPMRKPRPYELLILGKRFGPSYSPPSLINVTNYFHKLIPGNSWFSVMTWKPSQSKGILQSITFFSCSATPARELSQLHAPLNPRAHWGCFHGLAQYTILQRTCTVHTSEYQAAAKNQSLPFATTWRELGSEALSEQPSWRKTCAV